MDIYHTKKQTENIPRLCSYLLLKTLFYFISQCTSAPYLESGLCKLDNELDNCICLYLFSQETDLLIKLIMKCVNIKLWDILGCFHYILNPPRIKCEGVSFNKYISTSCSVFYGFTKHHIMVWIAVLFI